MVPANITLRHDRNYHQQQDELREQLRLAERTKRAYFTTRMAELDIYEQGMRQLGQAVAAEEGLNALTADEKLKLAGVRRKVDDGEVLDPFERMLLDKATKHAEQLGKRLARKTLRITNASVVQLLAIKAISPVYDPDRQLAAQKLLDSMRNRDPNLTKETTDEILALPLTDAYARVAELTLTGMLTREQADYALKALDYRTAAVNVDLASKYLGTVTGKPAETAKDPYEADGYED